MRANGGFEGNGQTLRILSKLEKFSDQHGADLTRRTLLGTLKYPVAFSRVNNLSLTPNLIEGPTAIRLIDRKKSKPPKCYMDCEQAVVDWILEPLDEKDRDTFTEIRSKAGEHAKSIHKSFDCSIMDLADDISFGIHDMEDSIALKLFGENDFRKLIPEEKCAAHLDYLKQTYKNESANNVYEILVAKLFGDGKNRKHAISRMVGHLIKSCTIDTIDALQSPMIRYRANMQNGPKDFLKALRDAVREVVILSSAVQHLEFKGQQMVVAVFEALASEPNVLLPQDAFKLHEASVDPKRVICDHVAGMTDSFLLKTYERLFSPRMGSVFDKL